MKTITQKQWNKCPKDYKGIIDGQKYMMFNENGATISRPVEFMPLDSIHIDPAELTARVKAMHTRKYSTPQRQSYCENCGRKQAVYEIILANESGFADYCKDCIVNNPKVRPAR